MIDSHQALADEVGEDSPDRIARRLFKATTCGIVFSLREGGIYMSGYCEGADAECQARMLDYPFTADIFWREVDAADQDGRDMWDQTHGCDTCWPEGYVDEWGSTWEPGEVGAPVNKECPECKGHGIIL